MTGAKAVADCLRGAGVETVFGYSGTSELALCLAVARTPRTRFVNSRGDTGAVFMAGGACLLRPGSAAAILHGARGSTNACGAIAVLRRNEIGMLVLVGLPSRASASFLPPHGETGLIANLGRFAKAAYDLTDVVDDDPSELVATLRDASATACAPPAGPVIVGLPQDVLERSWIPVEALDETNDAPPLQQEPSLEEALGLIRRATRPVVLVDDYLLKDRAALGPLGEFAELLAAPIFQVRYRRGPMLFERLSQQAVSSFVGWYDPADPGHVAVMAEADLLVTVEDRNMYPRVVGSLPPCPKLILTSDASKTRKNGYAGKGAVVVEATPSGTLARLIEELHPRRPGHEPPRRPLPRPVLEPAAAGHNPAVRMIRASIAAELARLFRRARSPVLVDDSQMFGGMLADEYDRFPAHLRVFGDHSGFVGAGIAFASGLALHEEGACVVCALGDQGLTNGLQGLVAAGERRAPVIFLVCNNGESVSLHKELIAIAGSSAVAADACGLRNAPNLDYRTVARGCGIESATVVMSAEMSDESIRGAAADLGRQLTAAHESSEPYLIELVLPPLGEAWEGIWITDGFESQQLPHGPHADDAEPAFEERVLALGGHSTSSPGGGDDAR